MDVMARRGNQPKSTIQQSRALQANAYTLLELIVVIAGLGILSSLAIPNFIKYLEFAQIDEAKVLLNTAAAQCLQEFRKQGWVVAKDIKPDALPALADEGEQSKLPGRYVFKDGNNKCEHIVIEDPAGSDSIFPLLGLRMTSQGKIVKYAAPGNRDSISAAESWGETSISEELLAEINYLGQCTVNQSECNTAFPNALEIASDGPLSVKAWQGKCEWPADPTCGCLRDVWACDNKAYYTADDFQECISAKASAACNSHRDSIRSQSPPFSGADIAGICPTTEWWLDGEWIGESEETYNQKIIEKQAALAEQNRLECEAQKKTWIDAAVSGEFKPTIGGCNAAWGCNESGTFRVYTSQTDYDSSPCGVTCETVPGQCTRWVGRRCLTYSEPTEVCRKP